MDRRAFLKLTGTTALAGAAAGSRASLQPTGLRDDTGARLIKLLLCGDVMTGRGIDQVLPHPNDPRIYEPYMRSALGYVQLAEARNGPIPRPVDFSYIWGDALEEMQLAAPDVRIANLETAITETDGYWRGKGINYRMHPRNTPCITAAGFDCCVLANNHVLDWGYAGLYETLQTLDTARVKHPGAGPALEEARAPAVLEVAGKGRVIVFAFGTADSGIPRRWAAESERAGVNLLADLSERTAGRVAAGIHAIKRPGDLVVVSMHWGGNWGYDIPPEHRNFAHRLIDTAGVDLIHGHSSHHAKGIEVYQDRPVVYGCGDLLNDYEGISGHEDFRDDLVLMYLVSMDPVTARLAGLDLIPFRIRRFRLSRASRQDVAWLAETLDREGRKLGTRVGIGESRRLSLAWG